MKSLPVNIICFVAYLLHRYNTREALRNSVKYLVLGIVQAVFVLFTFHISLISHRHRPPLKIEILVEEGCLNKTGAFM